MGAVLAVYAVLTCVVTVLSPDKLTPLVNKVANRVLDADVEIGRIELSAKATYPFLQLKVDSVCITVPAIAEMKCDTALHLPLYADTLFIVNRFVGELNMPKLLMGKIDIHNIDLVGPAANIVIVNDSVNNFDIVKQSDNDDDADGEGFDIANISLRRFSISQARDIRFYNAITSLEATVGVETLIERDETEPTYMLTFDGSFESGLLRDYNMVRIPVSLDGEIGWNASNPHKIDFRQFSLGLSWLRIMFEMGVDFGEELLIKDFTASCKDVKVADLIDFVPAEYIKKYELGSLKTDAEISLDIKLDSVFNLDRDSIPYATVSLQLPDCRLQYGKARFERLATMIDTELKGNNLDDAVVRMNYLEVAGPATNLKLSGFVYNLTEDPAFDMKVDGYTNLAKLPPPLLKFIDGYISGKLKASVNVVGNLSMFDKNNFHKLRFDGDIDGSRLYWLASDTANMVLINDACLKFGSSMSFNDSKNILAATLKVDTAEVLSGGVTINVTDLSLGFGAANQKRSDDTTIVVPMGGGLKIATLNVTSITDSAGARFRDIGGRVVMRRFKDMERVPEFLFDLSIDRMSAGSKDARMLFSRSALHVDMHKKPVTRFAREIKKTADSLSKSHPDLSPDSVYALALAHRRQHRSRHHRVHSEMTDSLTEIIDWGTSKALSRFLLNWNINGSLTSHRAGLFTPLFPLRNRLDSLSIVFNNDTILLKQIAYKVGRSDFLADGRITNVKGALTAKKRLSPLKIEFEAVSDTVDVNQLADGFFKGAANREHRQSDFSHLDIVDNDSLFEKELSGATIHGQDSIAPFIVPANIQADVKLRANNIIYSDLLLHGLTGNVMLYDGAINLHQMRAASDVGSIDLSALYSAPTARDMRFGFGLKVNDFDISKFVDLVPALDSIMPLLRDISGIVNADLAATVDIAPDMVLDLPTLTAAIKLQGDSLQLLDADTFKTIAKWLMFKDKQRNIIDHMNVEAIISDSQMQLFPFIFDIDRYRIGVQGHNDLALNFNYLISVLKSPLPFKFGITIKGNPDHYKIKLGRAKFDEKQAIERRLVVDTARINLIDQIENVFRRGVRKAEFAKLALPGNSNIAVDINLDDSPVSASDSLLFIKEGLIPAPAVKESEFELKKK